MPTQCTEGYDYKVKFLKKFGWKKLGPNEFEIESHKVGIGTGTFPTHFRLPFYTAVQTTVNRLKLRLTDQEVIKLFMEGKI